MVRSLLAYGAYSDLVRARLVQAQYFKDPFDMETYLKKNIFLPFINNEVESKRDSQLAENMKTLDQFVMFMWLEDSVVVPRESSHFGVYNATTKTIIPLKDQPLYQEDWIGLKYLDEMGKLVMKSIPGDHMHITDDLLSDIVKEYLLT